MKVDVDVRANHDLVIVEGVFLGANITTKIYDGKTTHEGQINLMNPESPSDKKTIEIKFKDVNDLNTIQSMFQFGNPFKARVLANAYQNKITYRLLEILNVPKPQTSK